MLWLQLWFEAWSWMTNYNTPTNVKLFSLGISGPPHDIWLNCFCTCAVQLQDANMVIAALADVLVLSVGLNDIFLCRWLHLNGTKYTLQLVTSFHTGNIRQCLKCLLILTMQDRQVFVLYEERFQQGVLPYFEINRGEIIHHVSRYIVMQSSRYVSWYKKINEDMYHFCIIYAIILRLLLRNLNMFKNSIYYMYHIIVVSSNLYWDRYHIMTIPYHFTLRNKGIAPICVCMFLQNNSAHE